jgi:hypothetical protein
MGHTILGKAKYRVEVREEHFGDNDFLRNGLDAKYLMGGTWRKAVRHTYN